MTAAYCAGHSNVLSYNAKWQSVLTTAAAQLVLPAAAGAVARVGYSPHAELHQRDTLQL
jgi:hypothetical protein